MTDGMFSRLSWQAVRIILLRTLYNYPVIKHGSVWRQPEGGDLPMARLLRSYLQVVEAACCRHAMLHPRKWLWDKCVLSNGCRIVTVWSAVTEAKLTERFSLDKSPALVFRSQDNALWGLFNKLSSWWWWWWREDAGSNCLDCFGLDLWF